MRWSLPCQKRTAHLLGPFEIIPVQVNRGGRNRRMAQVISHRSQFCPPGQRMGGVGMAHPMGSRLAQLFRKGWAFFCHFTGGSFKEPLHHDPKPGR